MTTVYIVTHGSHEDYEILRVFSSREKAETFCGNTLSVHDSDGVAIEEYQVDEENASDKHWAVVWECWISRDGNRIHPSAHHSLIDNAYEGHVVENFGGYIGCSPISIDRAHQLAEEERIKRLDVKMFAGE